MGKFIDLTGMKFGRLTVIERGDKVERGHSVKWLCACDCGNKCWVTSNGLRTGNSKSCGCLKIEKATLNGKRNYRRRLNWNTFESRGEITIGYDDKGNSFKIDTYNLKKVQQYCWYLDKSGYWHTSLTINGKKSHLKLHKFLCDSGYVDHHDRDKNNNTMNNLVKCSLEENNRNRTLSKNNSSGFSGVYWNKSRREWKASVSMESTANHKSTERFLGWFKNKEDAIRARLKGELEYYGEEFAPQRHLFEQYNITKDNNND